MVDERDLRFTLDEAVAMFADIRSIGLVELEALTEQTLGWATGLRLAMMITGGSDDPRATIAHFTGDIDGVAEYLNHEVMASESHEIRQFLAETSILDVMTPSLCEAVTGRAEAAHVLDELLGRHLFVSQVDEGQLQYRSRPLLFWTFKGRLQGSAPPLFKQPTSELRPGLWRHGDPATAVQHSLGHPRAVGRTVTDSIFRCWQRHICTTCGSQGDRMPLLP